MADPINVYFQHAQLSMAAYATLTVGMNSAQYKAALTNAGFSDAQAAAFVSTYSIVKPFNDSSTDFSATLFKKNGTNEMILAIRGTESWRDLLISDLQIGVFGLTNQYTSLENFYSQIVAQLQPSDVLTVTGHSLGGFLAQAFTLDHQNLVAHTYTYNSPGLGGVLQNPVGQLGIVGNPVPNSLITNLIAQGQLFISSTGRQFGTPQYVFIETSLDPFENHGEASITDAWALYDLFGTVDPNVSIDAVSKILEATASTDNITLERGLDALRKLFPDPANPTPFVPTPASGTAEDRNAYYTNLLALKATIAPTGQPRTDLHVTSLVNFSGSVGSLARTDLAYRYALRELNPFVVQGVDYQVLHNQDGSLDLYDSSTGQGTWTVNALFDRADLLAAKLAFNRADGSPTTNDPARLYVDRRTEFDNGNGATATQLVFFDDDQANELVGRTGNDHLYGGGGNDVLTGNGGQDYLEGNEENDELYGGADGDILLGQQGDDLLDGGAGTDQLSGGLGNDQLFGSTGHDTYFVRTGQGQDVIDDIDGQGAIQFDTRILTGGSHREGDPTNTFRSTDGQITYVKSGTDMIINGTLTVKHFTDGALGVRLTETPEEPASTPADRTVFLKSIGPNQSGPVFDETSNSSLTAIQPLWETSNLVHALGGDDVVISGGFDDQLFGEAGHDELVGNGGNDVLDGGEGDDRLFGGDGADQILGGAGDDFISADDFEAPALGNHDVADGGEGNDFLRGGTGNDELIGGAGDDQLYGDDIPSFLHVDGRDYLDGGDGNDLLGGGGNDDVLIGGVGNDELHGDDDRDSTGNDMLDGGEGNDFLFGHAGDDVLAAGTGNDWLFGEDGSDVLIGSEGNDVLSGDLRLSLNGLYSTAFFTGAGGNDALYGGAGLDYMYGGEGDDVLVGGEGDDTLFGEYNENLLPAGPNTAIRLLSGNDSLDGGEGNDQLVGGAGADTIHGGEGDDILIGGGTDQLANSLDGNDYLEGGAGNDFLSGGKGQDVLIGGAGNDYLDGDAGTDLNPDVGIGDDVLEGGAGDDTYVVNSANDVIQETTGTDTVISTISYALPDNIENLVFAGSDATVIGTGNDGDNSMQNGFRLEGLEGNDTLSSAVAMFGGAGNDTLIGGSLLQDGGSGNDTLIGGAAAPGFISQLVQDGGSGNDTLSDGGTYIFGHDYGQDTIQQNDTNNRTLAPAVYHTVQMAAGIAPSDVSWHRSDDDLVLNINGTTDQFTVSSFFTLKLETANWLVGADIMPSGGVTHLTSGTPYYYAPAGIEQVRFDDGTVWDTTTTFGPTVLGSYLDDTYQFSRGSGQQTILDFDVVSQDTDAVQMAADVTITDVTLDRHGDDLVLSIRGTSDQLTIQDHFHSVIAGQLFTGTRPPVQGFEVEQVRFADGTIWDVAYVQNNIRNVTGTDQDEILPGSARDNVIQGLGGHDFIRGLEGDDQLEGGSGNDFLQGGEGDDILDGGSGNDFFEGGEGDDTYLFGRGAGQDVVHDFNFSGTDLNAIRMAANIFPNEVIARSGFGFDSEGHLFYDNDDLVLGISGTADLVVINGFYLPFSTTEQVQFADGTVWDQAILEEKGRVIVGTDGQDFLMGHDSNDQIFGLGGHDVLYDSGGTDMLSGGSGDDIYRLFDANDDTIAETADEGTDTVESSFSYVLLEHVENLTLLGGDNLALNGTGNELDNILLGNQSDNVLKGQGGDDILSGGPVEFYEGGEGEEGEIYFGGGGGGGEGGDGDSGGTPSTDGNDILAGGVGHDTYLFVLGDGTDTIVDAAIPGEGNRILFDAGITQAALAFVQNQQTLTITIGFNGDAIQLVNFDPNHVTGSLVVETLEFADGGILNLADLFPPTGPVVTEGDDTLTFGPDDDVIDALGGNDTVDADGGNDTVLGGAGNDTLLGGDGIDTLDGGTGFDAMSGGDGNDTYFIDDLGDVVTELENGGTDTVFSSVSHTLTANVENLTLTGNAAIDGTGNDLDNVLTGNDAANVLTGGAGVDQLIGGAGDDTYVVDAGDSVVESLDGGTDAVQSAASYTLGAHVENLTLTGADAVNGTGNDLDNVLAGNSSANVLTGGDGTDTLTGGAGDDVLVGGVGSDTYVFNAGDGVDTIQDTAAPGEGNELVFRADITASDVSLGLGSLLIRVGNAGDAIHIQNFDPNDAYGLHAIDTLRFNDGTTLTYNQLIDRGFDLTGTAGDDTIAGTNAVDRMNGLTGDDTIQSGDGDDVLDGGMGNDILSAGSGQDQLTGGIGNDALDGGAGDDTYCYNLGDGLEQLVDAAGSDRVQFGAGISFDNTVVRLMEAAGITTAHLRLLDEFGNELADQGMDIQLGADSALPIEQFAFADGTTRSLADLTIQTVVTEGTRRDDIIRTGRHGDVIYAGKGGDTVYAGSGNDTVFSGKGGDTVFGEAGNDTLYGDKGDDLLDGGFGNDWLDGHKGDDLLRGDTGDDGLYGDKGDDVLEGGAGHDFLDGGKGEDTLQGGAGNDLLDSGKGDDTILFGRGDGQDTLVGGEHNEDDIVCFGTDIDPLDLMLSRQVDDLRVSIYETTDQFTVQGWYADRDNRVDEFVAGNGQSLEDSKVNQLIQAMAGFTTQTGLTWEQAISQRPQDVQQILAASWK